MELAITLQPRPASAAAPAWLRPTLLTWTPPGTCLQQPLLCSAAGLELRRQLSLLVPQGTELRHRLVRQVSRPAGLQVWAGQGFTLLFQGASQGTDFLLQLQEQAGCRMTFDSACALNAADARRLLSVPKGSRSIPQIPPAATTVQQSDRVVRFECNAVCCLALLRAPAHRLELGCHLSGLTLRCARPRALQPQLALQQRHVVAGCLELWRQLSAPLLLSFGQLGGEDRQALRHRLALPPRRLLAV